MRRQDKFKNMANANILAEARFLRESSLITEENINDFFQFIAQDPQKCSMASLSYMAIYNTGLAKPKTNPMTNRLIKITHYKFQFGHTYAAAAAKSNPDWELQQRKGNFEKIQGFDVLDRDAQGDEGLPIVNPKTIGSEIVVLDENGQPVDRFDYRELQNKLGEYFRPAAFEPRPPSGSGSTQRSLKVKRIIGIKAGGNEWTNPHHELQNLNIDVNIPNVPCAR